MNYFTLALALINLAAIPLHLSNARHARHFGESTKSHYAWAAVVGGDRTMVRLCRLPLRLQQRPPPLTR